MYDSGELPKGAHLPWSMYLVGTVILSVVAFLFSVMTVAVGKHYRFYHALYPTNSQSGIPVPPVKNTGRVAVFTLYFIFPIIDVAIRIYVQNIQIGFR